MFNFQSGEIMEQSLPRRLLETELMQTPSEANRTADPYYLSEMNFDTNMVVIMAALLFVLIGALGVNSIVRCVMRCSHRFGMEGPEEAAARLAATGLKKRDLGQIPVAVYGADANIKGTECPICLGEFEEGDKVRMLPICNHGFHVECIDTWLRSHSSCPNCRHSLLERPTKVERCFEEAADSQPPPESASSQQGSVAVVIASGN